MNTIRQIQALNKREIEAGVSPSASWHADYRDTAYIYIGGLPYELSEGDIITIFSQFGEPVHINLVRDKETGKSKGFAFLKYEDQRSTDLAVDNLGGASVMGRILRVDHTRYKRKDDEELGDNTNGLADHEADSDGDVKDEKRGAGKTSQSDDERPVLPEERELAELMRDHDDDDPMKDYLVKQKQEEVDLAIKKYESGRRKGHEHRHRHRHSHKHSRRRRDRSRSGSAGHDSSRQRRTHHRHSPSPSNDAGTAESPKKPRVKRSLSP